MFGIVPKLQSRVCAWAFWPGWTVRWFQSETGPFSIFFYTPLVKWGISVANINDMRKPIEQVNTLQQSVITLTGFLFTRWCFVIQPRVYALILCNFFMGCTGLYQLSRKQYELQICQAKQASYFEISPLFYQSLSTQLLQKKIQADSYLFFIESYITSLKGFGNELNWKTKSSLDYLESIFSNQSSSSIVLLSYAKSNSSLVSTNIVKEHQRIASSFINQWIIFLHSPIPFSQNTQQNTVSNSKLIMSDSTVQQRIIPFWGHHKNLWSGGNYVFLYKWKSSAEFSKYIDFHTFILRPIRSHVIGLNQEISTETHYIQIPLQLLLFISHYNYILRIIIMIIVISLLLAKLLERAKSYQVQSCRTVTDQSVSESFSWRVDRFSYNFWYKYQLMDAKEFDYIIFQSLIRINLIFKIRIKGGIAEHIIDYEQNIIWDKQASRNIINDQNQWYYFSIYTLNLQLFITIISSAHTHKGIGLAVQTWKEQDIQHNIPQNFRLMICDEKNWLKSDEIYFLSNFLSSSNQKPSNIYYEPDIQKYKTQCFNQTDSIIFIWFKDLSYQAQFKMELVSQFIDLILSEPGNKMEYQKIITIMRTQQQLVYQIYDYSDKIIRENHIEFQIAIDMWYSIQINMSQNIRLQTNSQLYTLDLNVEKSYPNAQLSLELGDCIFSQVLIQYDQPQNVCQPNCELCILSIFECQKCRGNRKSPQCDCPKGYQDFGQENCQCTNCKYLDIHTMLSLQVLDTYDSKCPIGYQQCSSERIVCEHGYIQFQNTCFQCPTFGGEVCQNCLVTEKLFQNQLFCKYKSQKNLQRFRLHQVNEYTQFVQQQFLQSEFYEMLELASVSIYYLLERNQLRIQQKQYDQIKQYRCPYGYQPIISIQNRSIKVCRRIEKHCLIFDDFDLYQDSFCKFCKPGYSLIDKQCYKCPQNCQSCSRTLCTSCMHNYYLSLKGICRFCNIPNCLTCYEYVNNFLSLNNDLLWNFDAPTLCAKCFNDYAFNYQTMQCQMKIMNDSCLVSIYNQTYICLIDNNTTLVKQKCLQLNCQLCYHTSCIQCFQGYYLYNNVCEQCIFKYSSMSYSQQLDCRMHDYVDYSDYKQSLQQLFVFHNKDRFATQNRQMQIVNCLNNETLYDATQCQTPNNVYLNSSDIYCFEFIIQDNKEFCIKPNSEISGLIIDRISGRAKLCHNFKTCDIDIIYNLTYTSFGQITYKNNQFEDIQQFIQSLNIKTLQGQHIKSIHLNLNLNYDFVSKIIIEEYPIQIDISIRMSQTAKKILFRDQIIIQQFNMILIDCIDLSNYYLEIHSNILKIQLLIIEFYQDENQAIKTVSLAVNELYISNLTIYQTTFDSPPLLFSFQLNLIEIQEFSLLEVINVTGPLIQIFQQHYVHIWIQVLKITSSHSLRGNIIHDVNKIVNVKIDSIQIVNSVFVNTVLIQSNSISVQSLHILNSSLFNSTIFLCNHIMIYEILISNCTLTKSFLINNFEQANLASNLTIQKIRFINSILLDSSIIYFIGNSCSISNVELRLSAYRKLDFYENSLIFIHTIFCYITDLRYVFTDSNYIVLKIESDLINFTNVLMQNVSKSQAFADISENCKVKVNLMNQEYIILSNFTYLHMNNTFISQIQSRQTIIRIISERHTYILINLLVFQQISIFSSNIMYINVLNLNITQLYYYKIWFYNIAEFSHQYSLCQISANTLQISELKFKQIKNSNCICLTWIRVNAVEIYFDRVLLNVYEFNLDQYFLNRNIYNISQISGINQYVHLSASVVNIFSLIVTNISPNNEYLILITYQYPIKLFNLTRLNMLNIEPDTILFKGIVYSPQTIQNLYLAEISLNGINIQASMFKFTISQQLVFENSTLILNGGGIIDCELEQSSKIEIVDIIIDSNKHRPWIQSQEIAILFKIRSGLVSIKNVGIQNIIGDILQVVSCTALSITTLVINKCQAIKNLIDVQSIQCHNLEIKQLIIQSHQIFQHEIYIQREYIFKDLGCEWSKNKPEGLVNIYKAHNISTLVNLNIDTENPIFQDLFFNENKHMDAMITLQNSKNILIQNCIAINNDCAFRCFNQLQSKSEYIKLRHLEVMNSSLTFVKAKFIQNNGILIQFISKSIYFNQTLLIHNDLIYETTFVENNHIFLQDSEVQYKSDSLLDLTNTLFNNSFIINLKSQKIQTIRGLTLMISLDSGITYYPTQDNKVIFYDNKRRLFDYCNMPTGQSLSEYKRLDLKLLSYQPFIKGMIFGLRGSQKLKDDSCSLRYGQNTIGFNFEQQNWENFTIYAKPLSKIQFMIICAQVNLTFQIVILNCQIGEIFINNKCIRCDSSLNLYSTQKNSVKCSPKTELMIEVESGLIKMIPGVWRPLFTNDQLEQCPLQEACLGGWHVGDDICKNGYIGALCQVCDIYDIKGYGQYIANSWNQCIICESSYSMTFYLIVLLIIQMGMYYLNSRSWENDCRYLCGIKLFVKQFEIMFKYSVDQFSIFIKIFTGFLQLLLIVTKVSPLLLPTYLKSILYQYSNPSVSIWQQLQCLYTKSYSTTEMLYFKPYIVLILNILLFNSYCFFFFILLIKQKKKFHFRNVTVTIYYIIIFNYGNYFELLLSISSWKKISGVDWVNENLSLLFNRSYRQDIQYFIYPQICLLIMLPLLFARILYYKLKELLHVKTFYYWGFFYRQFKLECYNQEIYNVYIRLAIIIITYSLNNNKHIRQISLVILIIWIQKIHLTNPPFINKQLNSVSQNLYNCLILEIMLITLMEQLQDDIQAVFLIQLLMCASLLIVVLIIMESFKMSFMRTYSSQIETVKQLIIKTFPTTSSVLFKQFTQSQRSSATIKSNFEKIKIRSLIRRIQSADLLQSVTIKNTLADENMIVGQDEKSNHQQNERSFKLDVLPKLDNSIIIE